MIDAYAVDDLVITQSNGFDVWGEPLSGTTVEIKGYVVWKTQLMRNLAGEEVTSTIMLYINKRRLDALLGRVLSHEERIESINGVSIDQSIIAIHVPKAFSNPHYEVFLNVASKT